MDSSLGGNKESDTTEHLSAQARTGTSQVLQSHWGPIPGRGTRLPHATWPGKKEYPNIIIINVSKL